MIDRISRRERLEPEVKVHATVSTARGLASQGTEGVPGGTMKEDRSWLGLA